MLAQHLGDRQLRVRGFAAELLAVARRRVLVLEVAVQEGGVRRVDADFQRLQPVAVPIALEGEGVGVGRGEAVEVRESGRLARAEPREQDTAALGDRIRALADVLAHAAALRFRRRLQAFAFDVEQPAVEHAAQITVLVASVGEVRAAMRAVTVEKAVLVF